MKIMPKVKNITSYTAAQLKAKRASSHTDLPKVECPDGAELEKLVAADADEHSLQPDWTQAKLVLPRLKRGP